MLAHYRSVSNLSDLYSHVSDRKVDQSQSSGSGSDSDEQMDKVKELASI